MSARKLHIFAAIRPEAAAIQPILPDGVAVTIIGIRAVRLPVKIEAGTVILAGFAGALDPNLRAGDIVHDDPPGTIYTSTDIVSTAADKAALLQQTGAKAVDMENLIVRQWAERQGIAFFGIRAISDTADESVDPLVLKFIDETGRLRPAAIARGLIQKPAIISTLNRLRMNSALASRALGIALREFLDERKELYS